MLSVNIHEVIDGLNCNHLFDWDTTASFKMDRTECGDPCTQFRAVRPINLIQVLGQGLCASLKWVTKHMSLEWHVPYMMRALLQSIARNVSFVNHFKKELKGKLLKNSKRFAGSGNREKNNIRR